MSVIAALPDHQNPLYEKKEKTKNLFKPFFLIQTYVIMFYHNYIRAENLFAPPKTFSDT